MTKLQSNFEFRIQVNSVCFVAVGGVFEQIQVCKLFIFKNCWKPTIDNGIIAKRQEFSQRFTNNLTNRNC